MKDISLFKNYLKDISKYPLISRDKEIELSVRIKKNDEKALIELVNANLKLVVKISLEYYRGTISLMDIIQNGNIGLIKAAKKFDPTRKVKFSTYAAFWIRQSILRGFIKPSNNLNISYRKNAINKKIRDFIKNYIKEYNKYPNVQVIMESVGVSRRDAVDILFYFQSNDYSLNDYVFEDGSEFIDSIPDEKYNPEKIAEMESMLQELQNVIGTFTEREREIIRKRFGFDYKKKETLQNLGNRFSITAEAARQIEKRVLVNIKNRFPSLSYYFYTN